MEHTHINGNRSTLIYIGIAAGAAVGLALALGRRSPRRRDPWQSAKHITTRMADHSQDFAQRSKDIIERAQNIYEEGRRIAVDAADLWTHGRKVVGV